MGETVTTDGEDVGITADASISHQAADVEEQPQIKPPEAMSPALPRENIEHRFSLSDEQFSRDRLNTLRDALMLAQSEHPEILALSLFGSMTKGTAKETSDIDAYVFVDSEQVHDGDYELSRQLLDGKDSHVAYQLGTDVQNMYKDCFRKYMFDHSDINKDQIEHLFAVPMCYQIIDEQVEELRKNYQEKSSFNYINHVTDMFHLQMGKGLDKYRSYLIDKLNKLEGSEGDLLWKGIMNEVITVERYREKNAGVNFAVHYPQSLEEATRIYRKSDEKPPLQRLVMPLPPDFSELPM